MQGLRRQRLEPGLWTRHTGRAARTRHPATDRGVSFSQATEEGAESQVPESRRKHGRTMSCLHCSFRRRYLPTSLKLYPAPCRAALDTFMEAFQKTTLVRCAYIPLVGVVLLLGRVSSHKAPCAASKRLRSGCLTVRRSLVATQQLCSLHKEDKACRLFSRVLLSSSPRRSLRSCELRVAVLKTTALAALDARCTKCCGRMQRRR